MARRTLAQINLIEEVGFGVRPNESDHKDAHRDTVKRTFAKRAEAVSKSLERKAGSDETYTSVAANLKVIISWRNFICHGTFKKMPDGRLHCKFYDRKSFDDDSGVLTKTFNFDELNQLAKSAMELSLWLYIEFNLEQHMKLYLQNK